MHITGEESYWIRDFWCDNCRKDRLVNRWADRLFDHIIGLGPWTQFLFAADCQNQIFDRKQFSVDRAAKLKK